jgi:CRP-like cAMP-binding protein/uncharacterized membrane protein YdbT with pleckstrin-like domain
MAVPTPDHSEILARFPIFRDLNKEALQSISATSISYDKGKIVFMQGDPIVHVYLVLSGHVRLERGASRHEHKLTREVGPYQVFGRLELDTLEGQLGTAIVTEACELLQIDKQTLIELRDKHRSLSGHFDRSEVIGHLRAIPYLASLSNLEIKWISDIVTIEHKQAGQTLYKTGQREDELLIMRQGRVRVESGGKMGTRWVSAGAVLGDRSTIRKLRRTATATAETECRYYELPGADLRALARFYPNADWLSDPISVEIGLQQAPLFQRLTLKEIRHLAGYTQQLHYIHPNHTIVRQNKPDDYYYILIEGSAKAQKKEANAPANTTILYPNSSFGEASLLLEASAEMTVETREKTNWLRVHHKDFRIFLRDHPGAEDRLTMNKDLRRRLHGLKQERKWQQEGEVILYKTRRHWIVLLRNLGVVFGAYFFLILCNLAVSATLTIPVGLQWFGPLVVICLPMPVAFWVIVDYLNDWHIVTSRRLVHEEKVILISERRTSAPLDKVQNIDSKRSFLARLLRYGHLVISTAAEVGEITYDFLPKSIQVMDLINRESARAKAGVKAENEELIRRQLQDRLHLGLEGRTDERALIEDVEYGKKRLKTKQLNLRLKKFTFGVQEKAGGRLEWRKHWLALLISVLWPFLLTVLSTILFALIATDIILQDLPSEYQTGLALLSSFVLLISIGWFWWSWTDWDNDRYILTRQHIEHIEQKPLFFDEQRQITTFERVQNVEFRKPNPIYILLNFGFVDIQTAATEGLVTFRYVPEPDFVQTEIYRRIERYRETQAEIRRKQQQSEMIDWLDAYHKLIKQENNYNLSG